VFLEDCDAISNLKTPELHQSILMQFNSISKEHPDNNVRTYPQNLHRKRCENLNNDTNENEKVNSYLELNMDCCIVCPIYKQVVESELF